MNEFQRLSGTIKKTISADQAQAIIFEIKFEDLVFTSSEDD
jgi:hypothetical protein